VKRTLPALLNPLAIGRAAIGGTMALGRGIRARPPALYLERKELTMTWVLQDDGKIRPPQFAGGSNCTNLLDLGKVAGDPVLINGNPLSLAVAATTATNTTITVAGTTAATLLFDTKANGGIGTQAFTYNDLIRALKVAGVIAT